MRILYLPNWKSQQRQFEKKRFIYPVLLAMQAEYYRKLGHDVIWDTWPNKIQDFEIHNKIIIEPEAIDFLKLPSPDRVFTDAFNKKYQQNGNFKYLPGTYIQVANGCWWGKCGFCVEKKNVWQVREVCQVYEEIGKIKRLGFKEIFDDSGTFPVGNWLDRLLNLPSHKIPIGCNMRMIGVDYAKMKAWGFRMLLFGLESANQDTLDKINKGVKVEDIKYIIKASKAGLEPHVAVMFGYPWETDKDAEITLRTVHYLLKHGYAKTAQASFYRNPLHVSNDRQRSYIERICDVARYPTFWFNKLKDIHDINDIKYLWKQIKEGLKIYGRN